MDAVIHNAGVYLRGERGSTPEGHAVTLAINTLAPFILTALIERPARLVYLSSGLHRGGEGSLADLDWTTRRWDGGKAYAETKLHAVALAFAVARRWPGVLANAVDPGWVRTKMGGPGAPVDLAAGQRTQSWLAAADDPAARFGGAYWHNLRRQQPAAEAADATFQDRLVAALEAMTGVTLP
jgi:NAD(P)-dependent dehydrogenase (short-subunit alcohol dehydrogenase family)